jgi:hypothetical protein
LVLHHGVKNDGDLTGCRQDGSAWSELGLHPA